MPIKTATPQTIKEAAALLRAGKLVAMPTETVYGLAANALDGQAVAKIFEAKGRPAFNPLIIHVPDTETAAQYAVLNEQAKILTRKFWPGPLTLILPRKTGSTVSELASAGLDTLAMRIPAHPVAQSLLKTCGLPLAAPSANKSGTLSPTTPAHVQDSLGDKVDMILAAGACAIGLESTVLDLSGETPVILRPGAITAEELSETLEMNIRHETAAENGKPKSPGLLLKHYAPDIPLRLNAIDLKPEEALLAFGSDKFIGVQGGGAAKDLPENRHRNLSKTQDLHEAAANLFAMLKDLDKSGAKAIAVMTVPDQDIGRAINDRLLRAAAAAEEKTWTVTDRNENSSS